MVAHWKGQAEIYLQREDTAVRTHKSNGNDLFPFCFGWNFVKKSSYYSVSTWHAKDQRSFSLQFSVQPEMLSIKRG